MIFRHGSQGIHFHPFPSDAPSASGRIWMEQLEEAAQRQAEAVSKASDILTEATEKIARVIDGSGDLQ
jgi:hypothetical protein